MISTRTGYANGHTPSPTYKEVYTDTTGYAEAVEVTFDPATIGLSRLLALFIRAIDPLSVNRQGADTGTRYRTGVYFLPGQEPVCRAVLEGLSVRLGQPVAVEASPLDSFFPAEEYHQDYLEKHTDGYCHLPFSAFRQAAEAAVWPETPVWTVTGTVPAAALGKTVVCGQSFLSGKDASDSDKETLTVRGLAFFRMLRKSGYTGFLDAAPRGFSRDLFLMEALSRETGVYIIPAYRFDPPEADALTPQASGDTLMTAARAGFPGTNIFPGFLKCAAQEKITSRSLYLLEAVARAHRETGLPVLALSFRKTAAELTDRLLRAGVAPHKLIIGHAGNPSDTDLLFSLAEKGVFLGMDPGFGNTADRTEVFAALCRAGFSGQLIQTVFFDASVFPVQLPAEQTAGGRRQFFRPDAVLPMLREKGVTHEHLWRIQWDNPRRFFEGGTE